MYFEPHAIVMPEENINIIMPTHSPSSEGPEGFPYYLARAVWCRSIPDDTDPRYGCGAELLERSRLADGTDAEPISHNCDLCGQPIPCQNLRKTEEFLYLCNSCETYLESIPEGQLKRSVKRQLIGNVL
jgi:hypothetical protein